MPLTTKQLRFVDRYLVDGDAKTAAIESGYSKKSAGVEACRLLKNEFVLAEISRRKILPPSDEIKPSTYKTPLEYMMAVMNNPEAEPERRDKMATAAAPYVHAKKGEGGKKDERQDAAKKAGSGKFGSIAPPRLVSSKK